MLCTRCKKRPAVIFITRSEGEKISNEGYCLVCAKELGIPQVNELIDKMGITDEDLEEMSDQLNELMGPETGNEDEGFSAGGPATFPSYFQGLLGNFRNRGARDAGQDAANAGDSPSHGDQHTDAKSPKKDKRSKEPEVNRRKTVNACCSDFTKQAREGKFDRIIGRDREIERMIQILSRRTKNNPCLIGEPGVGKTAIVEGLAQRIVAGNVPFVLRNKEVFLLDMTSLIAGTQFRGQFEGRIKALVDEVKADGNIILFIDEVHNLAGAGDNTEGGMSAANLMKPALSRGEIQVIGATTFKEYRKSIEKDAALERRFQPVVVEEPSVEETVRVLSGLKEYYEKFHGVTVDDALIRTAVELSERYINDRFLPDKAIDLLDEAAACASLRSAPLQEYREKQAQEKNMVQALTELENSEPDKDDTDETARYEKIATLQAALINVRQRLEQLEPEAALAKVTSSDVSKVIELWTGIDSGRIEQSDIQKLASLEARLSERIIGQDEAVRAVCAAMRRSRIRLYEAKRPASFIFAGPTGVGKTELVKVLAQTLFDTPDNMIRVDMSEFMEKHSVSRLLGSPPGYVGYDDAGQLTEKVRRKPYSVVLFDEIEKAHPDVMNVLLQILDDGRVTDARGRDVDFSNTVIVMTTNAGSENAESGFGFAKTAEQMVKEKTMKSLSQFLRPEFLGRVDEIIVFSPLSESTLERISALMLTDIKAALAKQCVTFGFTEEVCRRLAAEASGSKFGARELRNVIRRRVEDRIGDAVMGDGGKMPGLLKLEVIDGSICVIKA